MSFDAKQPHHPNCGQVGETGEHGDLGSNAIAAPERIGSAPKTETDHFVQHVTTPTQKPEETPLVQHITK
jgi:hypothetical protein